MGFIAGMWYQHEQRQGYLRRSPLIDDDNPRPAAYTTIVCYCPRCDYFIKTAVQTDTIGTHGCVQCDEPMEVYIAQGSRETVNWHGR